MASVSHCLHARTHAADTLVRLERRFDAYAHQWRDVQASTCASLTTDDTDAVAARRSLLCLQQHRDQFGDLLSHLRTADERAIDHVIAAVDALPRPDICRSPITADTAGDFIVQSTWPQALRRDYYDTENAARLGRYGYTSQRGDALLRTLDTFEVSEEPAGLRGSVLTVSGRAHFELGNVDRAEQLLWRALELGAEAGGGSAFPGKTWSHVIHLTDFMHGRHNEALALARAAKTDARYATASPLSRSELWTAEALALANVGDLPAARELLVRVLELEIAETGPASLPVGETLTNLGHIDRRLADYGTARRRLSSALEIVENIVGPRHPQAGYVHANLGTTALRLADPEAALEHFERVRQLWSEPSGNDVPKARIGAGLHAVALVESGRAAEAVADLERSLVAATQAARWHRPLFLFALGKALAPTDPIRARQLVMEALETASDTSPDDARVRSEMNEWMSSMAE